MIVVCGEALVDLVPVVPAGAASLLEALPGGGPANTAVALARLGQRVGIVTRVGADAFGALVRAHLGESGVMLDHVVTAPEPTALALVSVAGGEARYALYLEGTAAWRWQAGELPAALGPEVEALHTGSLTLASPSGAAAIEALVWRERGARAISFDPNVRLAAVADVARYRRRVERMVSVADLVRTSEEDLTALYADRAPEASLRRWASMGPRLVVMTRGELGSLALFGESVLRCPSRPVEVVDTVGAGDTFSAALLDFLSRAGTLRSKLAHLNADVVGRALAFAAVAAALTCTRRGADPPEAAEVAALVGGPRSSAGA